MTADILDAATLGYITGVVFAAVVLVLVVSLVTVHLLVDGVRKHVVSIRQSLVNVAQSTDPVPPVLTAINANLEDLAGALQSVGGHITVARTVFDRTAEGA